MVAGERFDLARGRGPHRAVLLVRPLAQGEDHHAAGLQKRGQLAKGAGALWGQDVHPHRAEQDEVEGETQAVHGAQAGQAVIEPAVQGEEWRVRPSRRMAAAGSTATTSKPARASQAASRPEPEPTSRASRLGPSGAGQGSRSSTAP